MTFLDVLHFLRADSLSEHEKGIRFERLIKSWFLADPRYSELTDVWLWEEFPSKKDFGGSDLGIDLVARTDLGEYWAIQCKFYDENTAIDKSAVDSFISNSSRQFADPKTGAPHTQFATRIWIATTEKWGANALEATRNQSIPFQKIGLDIFLESSVDWDALLQARPHGKPIKTPLPHQKEAIEKAHRYFSEHDRGKLIMACGCGKTYTSLAIIEQETQGRGCVLFLVPSISLLNQTLNAWMSDTAVEMNAICICSDPKASRKKSSSDDREDSSIDLALPSSTDSNVIADRFVKYRRQDKLLVVFSTYQSIEAVHDAQSLVERRIGEKSVFDWIVCDEAHRTTGVKFVGQDEASFTQIHESEYIHGKKRLYMTATPRLYGDNAKARARQADGVLCSMDDTSIYGEEFHRVGFSYAVQHGLLTDYKVLVLTVGSENELPEELRRQTADPSNKELNFDFVTRIFGCINGLSKNIVGDSHVTWDTDPRIMKRALAFCPNINKKGDASSSVNTARQFPLVSERVWEATPEKDRTNLVKVTADHIDGSMDSGIRAQKLAWLQADAADTNECRILCNVRCLSEGVDVPALDAVIFFSSRKSPIDVVQSVGRVMRNFRNGKEGEKKYGYIIIPVVVNPKVKPEEALEDNDKFAVVWSILNALRSHDESFNALVNKIALNREKPSKIVVAGVPPMGCADASSWEDQEEQRLAMQEQVARQLAFVNQTRDALYAKMVQKVGDRLYWEKWAKEVGSVAQNFIGRITEMVERPGRHQDAFRRFVSGLRETINSSIADSQAIEMLAQHLITRPVFDALFKEYEFSRNNPVSRTMEQMLAVLDSSGMEKDTAVLNRFYESVRRDLGDIDNLEGKQTVIKNLYEKFFKGAFPKTVDQLGIVYTPVECVDFILHSVNDILKKEFGRSLSDEGVHVLDPFTGTGTFITRLLQSGIIRPEDMERKYRHEIHCNEIVLLAYYVADVNIESVFHHQAERKDYLKFENICLTDTFELAEKDDSAQLCEVFKDNSEAIARQRKTPIRVIVGNPPYSAKQKSANDNAQNLSYPHLDKRIEETYVSEVKTTNKNSLYDSYIRAFRWSSDKLKKNKEGGVIGFITNGGWLDGNAAAGFRKCLEKEFSSIYVFHLRGDARTQGELRRKEGDGVFGLGSRAPVVITILVSNPEHQGKAKIHYCDIGDYLKREDKLKILRDKRSVCSRSMHWTILEPNEHGDWVSQRSDLFGSMILLGDKKDKNQKETFFEPVYSNGLKTQRDVWCYNFSTNKLANNITRAIDFYNEQCDTVAKGGSINFDSTCFSWTRASIASAEKAKKFTYQKNNLVFSTYRPFTCTHLYFSRQLNEMTYQIPKLFPTPDHENLVICVSGLGGSKDFSAFITNTIPDLNILDSGTQCFPLYYYKEKEQQQGTLIDMGAGHDQYERKDGITDWILRNIRARFQNTRAITKEEIFYYVYGILHSPEYRAKFADDLKMSLPRIPIADDIETFMDFALAGRKLADLHLNYESVPAYPGVVVSYSNDDRNYRVEKMRFANKNSKDCIIYNADIRIENIPADAYEYVVNGRSAIEWIMECYRIKTDRDSGITNDPNDWATEHNAPSYILDLLLSVINVSVQTVEIVRKLPKLCFEEEHSEE
ncbi:MAG: DEAD/DEAH box helicase family protein [Desulfovibrionaceae bacterium]|nr:DEAD/DEAH box helicase family protein [Desulfovibrionaceae bacterium]